MRAQARSNSSAAAGASGNSVRGHRSESGGVFDVGAIQIGSGRNCGGLLFRKSRKRPAVLIGFAQPPLLKQLVFGEILEQRVGLGLE